MDSPNIFDQVAAQNAGQAAPAAPTAQASGSPVTSEIPQVLNPNGARNSARTPVAPGVTLSPTNIADVQSSLAASGIPSQIGQTNIFDQVAAQNSTEPTTEPTTDQPGLFSRAYETSGAQGVVDLVKKSFQRPIDLYTQSVESMQNGDWKGAVESAGKLYGLIPDKDSPLAQAAQAIIMHPIEEAKASFKENRKKGQGVVESAVNASPIGAITNPAQGVHDTAKKAIEDAKGGNISGAIGDVLTAPLTSHLAGEIPVLGGAAQDIGGKLNEDLHNHNYAAVTGDIVGPLMTLGVGKAVGAFGEAGESAEGAESGAGSGAANLPKGIRPGSIEVAGEKIPVAASHPQLDETGATTAAKTMARPEAAKQFLREQVQPAAVRATQSNFAQSALKTADELRAVRGEEAATDTAPALHTVSDISNFLKKEAKGTYSKLDTASDQDIDLWEQNKADRERLGVQDTPENPIPPRPKTFTALQDQINDAENALKPRSGSSQVEKGQATANLPQYKQELQDFLGKHKDIVSDDELAAADKTHASAIRYDFIAKRMRTATKGTPAGKIFSGETPYFNINSLDNMEGQFENKFGEGSFKKLLGEDGYHNFNDILNALKTPTTGGFLQDWLKKLPMHTGEFAEMPVQRVADNILFNPTAGQTFLKMFHNALDATKTPGKIGVAAASAVQNKSNRVYDAARGALGGGSTTNPNQGASVVQQLAPKSITYDAGPLSGKPVSGMLSQGNIDLNHRPQIKNTDGTSSTIFSMTVPVGKDGHSVTWGSPSIVGYALVPSIANGKFLTPDGKIPPSAENPKTQADKQALSQLEDAATQYYDKTRQHLGIFKTADAADNFATHTHSYGSDGTNRKVYVPSTTGGQ